MTVGRAAEQGRHTLEAHLAGLGPPPTADSTQPVGPFRTDRAHLILIQLVGAQPGLFSLYVRPAWRLVGMPTLTYHLAMRPFPQNTRASPRAMRAFTSRT